MQYQDEKRNTVLPAPVQKAIGRLAAANESCFPVGGCVRDLLLGQAPKDWDLCTSALPEKTFACMEGFERFTLGAAHGTIGVIIDSMRLEITTFRIDGDYSDGRRPDRVCFSTELSSDLARRDFTVNAMALSPDGEIIDLFSGREDLKSRILRCVGDPKTRLREDSLRILRALRFSAVLGFKIEEATANALRTEASGLSRIAAERILSEWNLLLSGKDAFAVISAFPQVIATIFPEAAEALSDPARLSRACSEASTAEEMLARQARFFFYLGLDERILSSMPMSGEAKRILRFLLAHEADPIPDPNRVRAWLMQTGEEGLLLGKLLWQGKPGGEEALSQLEEIERKKLCFAISGPWGLCVNGSDVSSLTGATGAQIGKILEKLLEDVVLHEIPNERQALLDRLR